MSSAHRDGGVCSGGGTSGSICRILPGDPSVRHTVQGTSGVRRSWCSALSVCETLVGSLSPKDLCWPYAVSECLIDPPSGFNSSGGYTSLRGPVYPILCRMISLCSTCIKWVQAVVRSAGRSENLFLPLLCSVSPGDLSVAGGIAKVSVDSVLANIYRGG